MALRLPGGFTGEDLIVTLMACVAAAVVIAAWRALLPPEDFGTRMKALDSRRVRLREGMMRGKRRERRPRSAGMIRELLAKFNALKGESSDNAQDKLAAAGFRGKDALVYYLFLKLCLPMVLGLIGVLVVYVLKILPLPDMIKPVVAFGGVIIGFVGPDLYVKNAAERRRAVINKALPEGLDLLTICVEAGLSLDAALTRVSKELQGLSVDFAFELQMTAIELTFLPDRQMAFDNLALRVDLPGIHGLVNTLRQTEKYGTPLSQSLKVLSAEFRNERLMKAEEKGARLPALMTVPMMVFILPTLFIVIIGPGIISVLDNTAKM